VNTVLLAVAMVAAVNPFRTRLGLPEAERRVPVGSYALGAALALAVVGLLGWVSGPILDALEVSPEMFIIAAGFVALLGAARSFLAPVPREEPSLEGLGSALWPIAFPRLLLPEVLMLAIALSAIRGVAVAVVGMVIGLAVTATLAPFGPGERGRRVLAALGTVLAATLVVAATWMIIEGVRDV
jgi:small neutral amino acid transporter SnatA (MarC family)